MGAGSLFQMGFTISALSEQHMDIVLGANGASFDLAGRYLDGTHRANQFETDGILVRPGSTLLHTFGSAEYSHRLPRANQFRTDGILVCPGSTALHTLGSAGHSRRLPRAS